MREDGGGLGKILLVGMEDSGLLFLKEIHERPLVEVISVNANSQNLNLWTCFHLNYSHCEPTMIFGFGAADADGTLPTPDGITRTSLVVELNFACAKETSLLSFHQQLQDAGTTRSKTT
jgi:hypothetical protein